MKTNKQKNKYKQNVWFMISFIILILMSMLGIYLNLRFNNWLFLFILITPWSIIVINIFYRLWAKRKLNIKLKESFELYSYEDISELKKKITSDVEIIFKEKATHIFSAFGTGKTYYIQNLIANFCAQKYGTIIFYFNVWWIKRKNGFTRNLLNSKMSFSAKGFFNFNNDGTDNYLIFFLGLIFMIGNGIAMLLWFFIGLFWNFGQWKYRKLIIIDDPDRKMDNEEFASLANEKMVKGDVYIILHSQEITEINKIIKKSIDLPEKKIKDVNLRIFKKIKQASYLDEFNLVIKNDDFDEKIKEKLYMMFLLYKTVIEQNNEYMRLIYKLLKNNGEKLINQKFIKNKTIKIEENLFNEIPCLFIWRYDLNEIYKIIGKNLLEAEKLSIESFIASWQFNISVSNHTLETKNDFLSNQELRTWMLERICDFFWKDNKPIKKDLQTKIDIKTTLKEAKQIIQKPKISDLWNILHRYDYLWKYWNWYEYVKKFIKKQDFKLILNSFEKTYDNLMKNKNTSINNYMVKKIAKLFHLEENEKMKKIIKKYENININNFDINLLSILDSDEVEKLLKNLNFSSFSDQYIFLRKLALNYAKWANPNAKDRLIFYKIFKNAKIKSPNKNNLIDKYTFYENIKKYKTKVIKNCETGICDLNKIYNETMR